jgi:peptidoglycan/xylan/chitin deacetylase (PgdA/CDA1 family)
VPPYQPDALRVRRAAQKIARQRRLRRRAAGVLVLLLALAVAAGLVTISSVRRPHHRARLASSAPGLGLAARQAKAEAAQDHAAAVDTAQAAAARRLAATGRPLFCGGSQRRVVALTFDDGPGVYTHLAVRKLRENHLHATFFLVGKEIRAWPRQVGPEKPLAAFGDHTMTHPFLPALPWPTMVTEIARAKALIEQATGEPVLLFRPPYEGRSPIIDAEARRLGMVEVLWNVDSGDSLGADYAGIERNVTAGLKPGSIILMHENRGQTIRALPVIFKALRRDHLQAVTVPQLIAEDPPSRRQLRAGVGGCAVVRRGSNGS